MISMRKLSIVNDVDGQRGSAARFYQRAEIHCVKDDKGLSWTCGVVIEGYELRTREDI